MATNDISAVDRADALAASGRVSEAVSLLEESAAAGDGDSLFRLANWRLAGRHLPRDLAAVRDLLGRGAEAGHVQAGTVFANFLASGTGGDADWPQAVARLRDLARTQPDCARQIEVIEAMDIDEAGDPIAVPKRNRLSESPDVLLFPKLLSDTECRYLIETATPLFAPSTIFDQSTGQHIQNPVRTSFAAGFPPVYENPAIHALNRRLAAAAGTSVEQGEALQVLRYQVGQEFRPHIDASPHFDNQRILTMLVYLNEDYEGGATAFPYAELEVKGKRGDGLLFRNVADGKPDPMAAHAGLPVTKGMKFIASRWIRERPYTPPGPLQQ